MDVPATVKIFGLRALREAKTADHIAWAVNLLLAGENTLNLRMLASLAGETSPWEVEAHFSRALRELGLVTPEEVTGLREYAFALARRLASGAAPVDEMVGLLASIGWKISAAPFRRWIRIDSELRWARAGHEADYEELTNASADEMMRAEAVRFLREVGEGKRGSP